MDMPTELLRIGAACDEDSQVVIVGDCDGPAIIEREQWRSYCNGVALVLISALLVLACFALAQWMAATLS